MQECDDVTLNGVKVNVREMLDTNGQICPNKKHVCHQLATLIMLGQINRLII